MSWLLVRASPALVQVMVGEGDPRPLQPRVMPDPTPTRQDPPPPTATGACLGVGVGRAVSRGDWLPSPATVVAVTHTCGGVGRAVASSHCVGPSSSLRQRQALGLR